jgi:undecaprenyl pyrophosphate phosphatase UppP
MGWLVIIGTMPIALLGFVFSDQIETVARNLYLVSFTLIVFGILLGMACPVIAIGFCRHREAGRQKGIVVLLIFSIRH